MTDFVQPPARPLLRRPGDGESIPVAGVEHLFRLTAAHTGGRFAFEEFTLAPGVIGARPKSIMATTSTSTSSTAN